MQRKININNNRIVYYLVDDVNSSIVNLREEYKQGSYLNKSYYFNFDKNYKIGGYTEANDTTYLLFEFDDNHPLYIPLVNILANDNILIINDELTNGRNKKYLRIYKNDSKVFMEFVNNLCNNKNKFSYDKFNLFVKNNVDIKSRLQEFLKEVNDIMDNELEDDNAKKLIKKRN